MDEVAKAIFKEAIGKNPYTYQDRLLETSNRFLIVNKARQIGVSTILAFKSLVYALAGHTVLLASPSERQSYHLMSYVERFLNAIPAHHKPILSVDSKSLKRFEAGGEIYSLPNSPSQIRGYKADLIVLDEFAHFLNGTDEQVYEAITPSISRGGALVVVSTPFGDQNLFYKLWNGGKNYEKITINWRECEDLKVDPIRKEMDTITFSQEYENEFRGEVVSEFPMAMLQKCVDAEFEYEVNASGDQAGFDVGRRRDLSAIAIVRKEEEVLRLVEKHVWHSVPFEEQQNRALEIAKRVGSFLIDQGGMGEAPSEWLRSRAVNVRPILFTNQIKTDMFLNLKRLVERQLVTFPLDTRLMASLNSVRRYYSQGRVIIDAERTDETGHADEATALALACWEPPESEAKVVLMDDGMPFDY